MGSDGEEKALSYSVYKFLGVFSVRAYHVLLGTSALYWYWHGGKIYL